MSNLLCGIFFSKGLWGLVAMLASSANQLVLGEQTNSWCDTPDPRWYNPGDLWSSSTSWRSGMSSEGRATVMLKYNTTDHDFFQMDPVSELYRNPCDTQVRKTGLRYTWAGQRTRPFYQYSASNSFSITARNKSRMLITWIHNHQLFHKNQSKTALLFLTCP